MTPAEQRTAAKNFAYDWLSRKGRKTGVPIFRWILDFRFKTIMAKNQWSNYFIPKITFKFAFKSH